MPNSVTAATRGVEEQLYPVREPIPVCYIVNSGNEGWLESGYVMRKHPYLPPTMFTAATRGGAVSDGIDIQLGGEVLKIPTTTGGVMFVPQNAENSV